MDLKLDLLTGDLDLSSGGLSTVSGGRQRQQQLKLGLGINLGEWFANTSEGLPYINTSESSLSENIQYMLGSKVPNQSRFIQKTIDDYIDSKSWVLSLESEFNFDRSSREFTYTYKVITEDGTEFTDSIS